MDLTNYASAENLRKNKDQYKRIFLYRVCGTGMGATACLLKQAGYEVEGQDSQFYPPMSDYLHSVGIPCHGSNQVDEEKLKSFDLIVVGNVVPRDSDEAKKLEALGVPFTSFPSALGALVLKEKEVIGIAGTHGKTTTAYFLAQLLSELGQAPGHFIGGVLPDRAPASLGNGKYFVIESDEYDSAYFEKYAKFRSYELDHMILTSLEFDHADIYENLEQIKDEFKAVLPQVKGEKIFNENYDACHELGATATFYGCGSQVGPLEISYRGGKSFFSLAYEGDVIKFSSNLVGEHNVENLTACILIALKLGFTRDEIEKACQNLKLAKRRQEERGHFQGSLVLDDFGHHPRAIASTLEILKLKYPEKNIVAIFEPVSATARSSLFEKEFIEALKVASATILAKPPRENSIRGAETINLEKISGKLMEAGKQSSVATNLDELVEEIKKFSNPQNVIVTFSNGTCLGLWKSDFIKQLEPL